MLTKQLGVYQQEEHALRVLLEEEVMEKMHSQQKRGAWKGGCGLLGLTGEQLIVIVPPEEASSAAVFVPDLFWPRPTPSDPMEACKHFYQCARTSEEARIAIR